jgi:hypothetical protein
MGFCTYRSRDGDYYMNHDGGFSIVGGDLTVHVHGSICKRLVATVEVQDWLNRNRDNGLTTKIVEIIKREMKVDGDLSQPIIDEFEKKSNAH